MATATKGGKKAAKKAPKAKKTGVCLMTGQPTSGGNFRPGMDARLKGALIKVVRGENNLNSIPKAAINRMRENGAEGLVGFRLSGDRLVKIGNFSIAENGKGEKRAKAKKELNSKAAFKGSAKSRRKDEARKKLAKQRAAEAASASADEGEDTTEESEEEE